MTGITQTTPLTHPFFDGKRNVPEVLPPNVVGVNNVPYLIDTKSGEWRQEGVQVLQQRNTDNPRDLLLLPQDVWRESVDSWVLGSGQSEHDHTDSLPHRFAESFGIDPWTPAQLTLLHKTERSIRFDSVRVKGEQTTHKIDSVTHLVPHLNWVVGSDGHWLLWYDDDEVDVVAEHLGAGIIDMCSDGEWVYILTDDKKVARCRDPKTREHYTDLAKQANFIDYVKHYLLVGQDNVLVDITDKANHKTVFTAPAPGFKWAGACEGNNAIYLVGSTVEKSVVHRVGVKQDGTGLTPGVVAAELPDGEIAVSIGSYLGFVFIGMTSGLRMAGANGQGDLTLGAVIPTHGPVYQIEGQDRFVWYGEGAQDDGNGHRVPGLGRIDMSSFTVSNFTPAYANDLFANPPDGSHGNTVRAVVSYGNRRVFSVEDDGVYFETLRYVDEGWLTIGNISFGVDDLKTSLYMQGKWKPLPEGCEIEMGAFYDSTTEYTPVGLYITKNSVRSGNTPMGRQFTEINPKIILRSDSKSKMLTSGYQTPVFNRWEIRAKPALGLSTRWYVPIIVSATIELNGAIVQRDCQIQHDELFALCTSGEVFPYVEGRRTHMATVKDYRWTPDKLQPTADAWQGVFLLVVEEIK